jgi:hypothetical protein
LAACLGTVYESYDSPIRASEHSWRICLPRSRTLRPAIQCPAVLTLLRPPIAQTVLNGYGNLRPFPIAYAFRPRLRGRLTLRRLPLRRKPWTFGGMVSRHPYRYLCQHDRFRFLQHGSLRAFTGWRNAPLPILTDPGASAAALSPGNYRRRIARPVSYYALFKG